MYCNCLTNTSLTVIFLYVQEKVQIYVSFLRNDKKFICVREQRNVCMIPMTDQYYFLTDEQIALYPYICASQNLNK